MTTFARRLPFAALAATAALSFGLPAAAQDKPVTLRIAHWLPPQHALHPTFEMWGRSIEQASGGTIKFQIYPSQQLGQAKDHYDMARDGIADVAFVNPGYQPGRFPVIGAGELPFLFGNAKAGSGAFDAWYRRYAEREMPDVKVCAAQIHSPGTFHSRAKITKPEDVKGLKVRSANATTARMVTMLGGTNIQVSAPEAREAMERGVADAITFPWDSIILFGIDKVARQHMDAPLYVSVFTWVLNKGAYERMSPAQRKVIDDHCTNEWAEKVSVAWAEKEASGRDRMRTLPGHTLNALTPEEVRAWETTLEPLTKEWMADVAKKGLDGRQVLDELKAEIRKRDSAAF